MISNAAVGIILDKRRRFLLQKKDKDYSNFPNRWCLFGGQIDKNETPDQAFDREMSEELMSKIKNKKFLFEHKFNESTPNGHLRGILYCFSAIYYGEIKDFKVMEGAGFAFLEKEELNNYLIHKPDKEVLDKYNSLFKNPPIDS